MECFDTWLKVSKETYQIMKCITLTNNNCWFQMFAFSLHTLFIMKINTKTTRWWLFMLDNLIYHLFNNIQTDNAYCAMDEFFQIHMLMIIYLRRIYNFILILYKHLHNNNNKISIRVDYHQERDILKCKDMCKAWNLISIDGIEYACLVFRTIPILTFA